MRRFEVQSAVEESLGEVLGEGAEFTDGAAVVRWNRPFSSSVENFPGGMEAVALHIGRAKIVFLDKPPVLAPPEEEGGKHSRPVDLAEVQAIEHLTQDVWDGQPLPGQPQPPAGNFIYSVAQGGLTRCCLLTLDEAMEARKASGWNTDGEDGDVIGCAHSSTAMIRTQGVWEMLEP